MEQELKQLIAQKDALEKTLAQLTQQLQLIEQTKDFNKGLVDAEGFPRADIDFGELANYKNLKRKKAELNNDHLALMKQIQQKLFNLHASYPQKEPNHISQTFEPKQTPLNFKKKEVKEAKEEVKSKIDYLTPFARVSLVSEHSPAAAAGMQPADLLSEFADINIYSLDWLKQLPTAVKEGQPVRIVLLRKTEETASSENQVFLLKDGSCYRKIQLQLVPNQWPGRGLLGCKIDPLPKKAEE